jgi:hypothetical protein
MTDGQTQKSNDEPLTAWLPILPRFSADQPPRA